MKKKHGIPDGKITYTDLNVPAKSFFSKRYRIAGKPDYILEKDNFFIPVEFKTGNYLQPQKNHILQLAAYCQLLEENYSSFVPYGVIMFNNGQQHQIPFNPKLRFELESVIKKMKLNLKNGEIQRNHDDPRKCRFCSMKSYCENKLI